MYNKIIAQQRRSPRMWTEELLIAAIRERARSGLSLLVKDVQDDDPGVVVASYKFFDAWPEAVDAAGYKYYEDIMISRWSKKKVGQALLERQAQGLSLDPQVIKRDHSSLYYALRTYFKPIAEAYRFIGIPYVRKKGRTPMWTKPLIIHRIQALHATGVSLNSTFIFKQHLALWKASCRLLGSWENAVAAAEIEYEQYRKIKPRKIQ